MGTLGALFSLPKTLFSLPEKFSLLPKLQESSALSRVHKAWKCAKMVSAWTAWLSVQASGPTVKPCEIRN